MENKIFNLPNVEFVFEEVSVNSENNAEEYVKKKYQDKGYSVQYTGIINGTPDLKCKKDNEEFYIEVKLNNDGLRHSQIEWILNNTESKVYIYYIVPKRKQKIIKLQSQISRIHNGKGYRKYWIVLPSSLIEKFKWESKENFTSKDCDLLKKYMEEEECKQKEE